MPEPNDNKAIEPQLISELIDLIYAVALDANQWPLLVEALSDTIDGTMPTNLPEPPFCPPRKTGTNIAAFLDRCYDAPRTGDAVSLPNEKHLQLGEALRPHLKRATALAHRLQHNRETSRSLENILDQLPVGILICDADGMVTGKNRRAREILASRAGLSIQLGQVVTDSPAGTSQLHSLIRQVCENDTDLDESGRTCSISHPETDLPLSLLISSSPPSSSGRALATLFIAAPDMPSNIPLSRLQGLYGLTPAESRLVNGLINGKDIDTICTEYRITRNTARTHLKAVFAKTRTSRQSELIRLVLLGPAMAVDRNSSGRAEDTASKCPPSRGKQTIAVQDHCITLADGRTLGYREYGDADGIPVIHMHTIPASRRQMHPDTDLPARLGIRLIAPDRPGIGLSSPMPGRSVTDWCDDIRQLARHIGLERFGVIGYGAGTPYALAVAAFFPDRVERVALASAVFPEYSLRDLHGIGAMQRMLYTTARSMPALLVQLIRHSAHAARSNPDRYIDILSDGHTGPDREILADPLVAQNLKAGYLDASEEEGRYTAEDSLLQIRHWGFDFSAIRTPVRIWHGEKNRQNPIDFSRRLAGSLPCCELTVLPDAGHFLIYSQHWVEALSYAAGIL